MYDVQSARMLSGQSAIFNPHKITAKREETHQDVMYKDECVGKIYSGRSVTMDQL